MNILNGIEIAWLAGLLEGEGCFTFDKASPRIKLHMTDEDIMHRVADLFAKVSGKKPNVRSYPDRRPTRQPSYQLDLSGESARIIMRMIVPLMGHRRRKRIWQILNGYNDSIRTYKAVKLISELAQSEAA